MRDGAAPRATAWLSLALGAALALVSGPARAHELDSASLSLKELDAGSFAVRWHASSRTLNDDLGAAITFPTPCRLTGARLVCGPAGLVGEIGFPWLEGTLTRVVVDVAWRNGTRLLRVASPGSPRVRVYGIPATGLRALVPIVVDYTGLGVEHILTGLDHLLFVVALTLLVRRGRQLLATITAFTLAHSVSLALTVLGFVRVPSPPVEASIALSIVLVCGECLRPADSLTRRAPWAVAFAFGLLHGLGFASALLDSRRAGATHPDGARLLQPRRRAGATRHHRRRARPPLAGEAPSARAPLDASWAHLRDGQPRRVLVDSIG